MSRHYFKTNLTDEEISLANQWIEALRSGKYEQGTDRLQSIDCKYCCLGVLCEIDSRVIFDNIRREYMLNGHGDNTVLPYGYEFLLKYRNGWPDFTGMENLGFVNDNGASFNQIADILELDLKGELTIVEYNIILEKKQ